MSNQKWAICQITELRHRRRRCNASSRIDTQVLITHAFVNSSHGTI
jgi:hypothetical protein